jgi:hypothetical protein
LISEVMFNPRAPGIDTAYEWFELYNAGTEPVDLSGWTIEDDKATDPLPAYRLQPQAYVVVAATAAFRDDFPDYDGILLLIADGSIGDGLANTGDRLVLRDPRGHIADALSYGNNESIFSPPAPVTRGGATLERLSLTEPTGSAADFVENDRPSPGLPFVRRPALSALEEPVPAVSVRPELEEGLSPILLLAALVSLPVLLAGMMLRRRRPR